MHHYASHRILEVQTWLEKHPGSTSTLPQRRDQDSASLRSVKYHRPIRLQIFASINTHEYEDSSIHDRMEGPQHPFIWPKPQSRPSREPTVK